jgi:hypothetical protein
MRVMADLPGRWIIICTGTLKVTVWRECGGGGGHGVMLSVSGSLS